MAYGVAGQIVKAGEKGLDINLSYFPNEAVENREFSYLVASRPSSHYFPSHVLARRLGISSLAVSRVASTLMVSYERGGGKTNIGLALKFESKGLKVLGYTRKADRGWEFSEKAARAFEEYKKAFPEPFRHFDSRKGSDIVSSRDLCPSAEDPDQMVRDMHKWLKTHGLSDLETVSLFAEQLEQETVHKLEQVADRLIAHKSRSTLKRALIQSIPRQAVLKPSHAIYRLQGQRFDLGDRVIMVQNSSAGGVALGMKGVVIGLGTRDIDVVWDVAFMGGDTMGGRCSPYRGSTLPFTSCLNLTYQQLLVEEGAAPRSAAPAPAFQPQLGPRPVIAPHNYRPAIPSAKGFTIAQNPNRPVPAAGGLQYGNAAKGIHHAPAAHGHAPGQAGPASHQARLQGALVGQQRAAVLQRQQQQHTQQPPQQPRAHVAHTPHIKPVSPTAAHRSLPGGSRRGGGNRGAAGPGVPAQAAPPAPVPAGGAGGDPAAGAGTGSGAANGDGSAAPAAEDGASAGGKSGRGRNHRGGRNRGGRGRGRGGAAAGAAGAAPAAANAVGP